MKLRTRIKRMKNRHQRFGLWHIIRDYLAWFRQWILEDKANDGLGGPPNNWQSSPKYPSCQWGMSTGHEYFSLHFNNDAGEVWISTKFTDDDKSQWVTAVACPDFRKLALWYLWRWAWGEWFGLRRKLYYRWLHRHVGKMLAARRT